MQTDLPAPAAGPQLITAAVPVADGAVTSQLPPSSGVLGFSPSLYTVSVERSCGIFSLQEPGVGGTAGVVGVAGLPGLARANGQPTLAVAVANDPLLSKASAVMVAPTGPTLAS